MEVGTYHDGFCDSLAMDIAEACCGVGDSGLAHQVSTFSGCADDLRTGEILQVVHMGDRPISWSSNLYGIESGSQVYGSFFEEFLESHGDTVDDENFFSSTDGRSVREDHPNIRGHAMRMRPGS